jgi:hypothetical protein
MRSITVRRDKRTEIKMLQQRLEALQKKRMTLVRVSDIRLNLQKCAEANMRISILKGELDYQ